MKIIVLGGSGFIGFHVANALMKAKHTVKIFDIRKNKKIHRNINFYKGNINNKKKLMLAMKNSDIVFNFAALADIDIARNKPLETVYSNIAGTINILEVCKKLKIKKIIHASSIYADSKEGGYYAISKRSAEDYIEEFCKLNKLNFTILRFGSIYGKDADKNNGIQRILNYLVKKRALVYRGQRQASRKYINVEDAAICCVKTINRKFNNKYLNITGKKKIKMIDLLNKLSKDFKVKRKIKFLNEKNTSHYNVAPTPYKIRKSSNLYIAKEKNFYSCISKLISLEKGKI